MISVLSLRKNHCSLAGIRLGVRQAAFLAFLAISLLAHAVCFYIFQVVYPPAITLLPPPARVALITPASEEGRTLLRWIDAEDPAVAFTTHRPPEARLRGLPKVEHVPSYHAMEPTLKELPALEVDSRAPTLNRRPRYRSCARRGLLLPWSIPTSVSFSKELNAFGSATLPELKFASSNGETPETIRFRVAINKLGEIRYCFPMNSSGDPGLDQQARLYITRCRFPRSELGGGKPDASLTWGIAIIEWGSDIARPQPSGSSATP